METRFYNAKKSEIQNKISYFIIDVSISPIIFIGLIEFYFTMIFSLPLTHTRVYSLKKKERIKIKGNFIGQPIKNN